MKRFRLQNNVPDVYVKQSRDFQLMCNLFDIVNNGIKFDIDTIVDLSDTSLCRESMLPYLQSKLGLELSKEIPSDTLRTILSCFPYLVNNKGSHKGIVQAICLFLHVIYVDCHYEIEIKNNDPTSILGPYVVQIKLDDNVLKNLHILNDLLKYVLPCGYLLSYDLEYKTDDLRTYHFSKDKIDIIFVDEYFGSAPRKAFSQEVLDEDGETLIEQKVFNDPASTDPLLPGAIGAIGATLITASTGYKRAVDDTDGKTVVKDVAQKFIEGELTDG